MDQQKKKDSVLLLGLHKREGKYGEFFSGRLGMCNVIISENKKRKDDKSPTHWMRLEMNEYKPKENQNASNSQPSFNEEDIPF